MIDGDNNIETEQLGKIRDDKPIKQDAEYTKRSPELGNDRNLGDFNSKSVLRIQRSDETRRDY